MKKIIFASIFLTIGLMIFGQSPQSFKYQSVIRNSSGLVIPNQLVSIRIGIIEGLISGPLIYQEEHSVTTNDFGLVNLEIGNGNVVSGDFSLVPWGSDSYFIKIELDENGGTNYQLMGVSQLLSVPYAMFAEKAGNVNNNDTSAINELQIISISNDTMYLTNGGYAVLPAGFSGDYDDLINIPINLTDFTNDAGYITDPTDADSDPTNELQNLTMSNDTLYLSNSSNNIYFPYSTDTSYWEKTGNDLYYNIGNVRVGDGTVAPSGRLQVKSDSSANINDVIFSVQNSKGDTVFAVYQEGVRIWVADDTSSAKAAGSRGGFAVGGFNPSKATTNEYLRVTPDSVRVYIEEGTGGTKASGNRGGFAVGGFTPAKSFTDYYMNVEYNDDPEIIDPAQPRMLWYPFREAFRAGNVLIEDVDSVGVNSMATGNQSKAIGNYSQAFGYKARAFGNYSTAIGNYANAIGNNSFAFGDSSIARHDFSYAFGKNAQADSISSFALGNYAIASGRGSYALGSYTGDSLAIFLGDSAITWAAGDYSFAMGMGARADSLGAFSIGLMCVASEVGSFAIGNYCISSGLCSFSLGGSCVSSNYFSLATGYETEASGSFSTAMGDRCIASGHSSFSVGKLNESSGDNSSTFGYNNIASGLYSVAMGNNSRSYQSSSLAAGSSCWTTRYSSVAMGHMAKAYGENSISIGYGTTVDSSAYNSFALGYMTKTVGPRSFTLGSYIVTEGSNTFVIGLDNTLRTVTQSNTMIVMGGNVGIGTIAPDKLLHVAGDARVEGDIFYGATGSVTTYSKPDYVFQPDYKMNFNHDILEVDKFIQKNQHLPWLTSAKDEIDGINITRMSFETLEAVENIQMQIIELKKEKDKQINDLLKRIEKLEKQK
ncbi:MAG: hypothetical protein ABIJ97_04505 [Bacteroidota bacterium]